MPQRIQKSNERKQQMNNLKTELVDINTLKSDPQNARYHTKDNLKVIKTSLEKFGQQRPIIVNSDNIVIAGNGILKAAIELKWTEISIIRTDLNNTDQLAYALADNRASELSIWETEALQSIIEKLEAEKFDIDSIGFDEINLSALIPTISPTVVNSAATEWTGMPEFNQEDKRGLRSIIIHFEKAEDIEAFAKLIEQNITDKTKWLWYPKAKIDHVADKRWSAK